MTRRDSAIWTAPAFEKVSSLTVQPIILASVSASGAPGSSASGEWMPQTVIVPCGTGTHQSMTGHGVPPTAVLVSSPSDMKIAAPSAPTNVVRSGASKMMYLHPSRVSGSWRRCSSNMYVLFSMTLILVQPDFCISLILAPTPMLSSMITTQNAPGISG